MSPREVFIAVLAALAVALCHGDLGPTGPIGATGSTGYTGAPGRQGPSGPIGSPGPSGPRGEMGERGSQGATGASGPYGSKGERGYPGERGPSGYIGPPGHPGPTGNKGPKGGYGATGNTGSPGPIGSTGASGWRGATGARGHSGPSGPPGSRGMPGVSGLHGATGLPGIPGMNGSPGGSTGATGRPGPPGETITDVDECNYNDSEQAACAHICINTFGSYYCACYDGYELDSTKRGCADVDECWDRNGHCEHSCKNTEGSYECSCRAGYDLEQNGLMCVPVSVTTELPLWLIAVIAVFGSLLFILLVSNCALIGVIKRMKKRSFSRSTRSTASLPSFAEIHGKGSVSNSVNSSPWPQQFSTTSRNQALPNIPDDHASLARQSSYSGYLQPIIAPYENGRASRLGESGPGYLELPPEGVGYQGLQRSSVVGANKYETVAVPAEGDLKKGQKSSLPPGDADGELDGVENSELFTDNPQKVKELEGDNNSQKKLIEQEEEETRYHKF